jgi:thiol-disulfide isomerase/thioredoxin
VIPISKINVEYGLEEMLKSKSKAVVLFYASWCPFSQRFLPTFEKFSKSRPESCLRIVTDDKASLCEKYEVDVVPTVLVFEKGKVAKRLDAVAGKGLSEKQLVDFVSKE